MTTAVVSSPVSIVICDKADKSNAEGLEINVRASLAEMQSYVPLAGSGVTNGSGSATKSDMSEPLKSKIENPSFILIM